MEIRQSPHIFCFLLSLTHQPSTYVFSQAGTQSERILLNTFFFISFPSHTREQRKMFVPKPKCEHTLFFSLADSFVFVFFLFCLGAIDCRFNDKACRWKYFRGIVRLNYLFFFHFAFVLLIFSFFLRRYFMFEGLFASFGWYFCVCFLCTERYSFTRFVGLVRAHYFARGLYQIFILDICRNFFWNIFYIIFISVLTYIFVFKFFKGDTLWFFSERSLYQIFVSWRVQFINIFRMLEFYAFWDYIPKYVLLDVCRKQL